MPTLRRMLFVTSPMMRGDDVLFVQRQLGTSGSGPTQDGLYGENTASAVRAFQRARNLDVDGIVGKDTWRALFGNGSSGMPDPLSAANLAALGALHTFYKDGCRWRLIPGGIEAEGEPHAEPASSDRTRVASVMTQFRQSWRRHSPLIGCRSNSSSRASAPKAKAGPRPWSWSLAATATIPRTHPHK